MLTVLRHIIQEMTNTADFKEALEMVVRRISHALQTEACSIFLLDRNQGEYVLAATYGLNQAAIGKVRVPLGQGLIGWVGEREEPLNVDEAREHPRFLQMPALGEEAYRAFLGIPMIYRRQVLGVLVVQHAEPRRYDESEEAFLVTLGTQLAAIIAQVDVTETLQTLFTPQQEEEKEKQYEALYSGVPGAPGIGMGVGVVLYAPLDFDSVPDRTPDDVETEVELLDAAFSAVREDLRLMSERLYPSLPTEERALFDVYQRILDSTDLGKEVADRIRQGHWAPGALRDVVKAHIRRLESLENEYMRERAEDMKDLGLRVLSYLQKHERVVPHYAEKTILIGESLTATDLAEVPAGQLVGMISRKGSSHSHVAILARAMNVPTIMGASEAPIQTLQGKQLIVDAHYGQIYVSPSVALSDEYCDLMAEEKRFDATLQSIRDLPAVTKDEHAISVMVNMGLGADIGLSFAMAADGVGLYRTEIPFQIRDRFPSSEEQRLIYRRVLTSFSPRPVTLRTLDIGGDKPLPYFPFKEDNPFLGWRGIRISLDHPDIFLSQVRAMIRASEGLSNLRIMLPMITDVTEVDESIHLLRKAYTEVREEGYQVDMPSIGVMIEVPSAVYQARALAKRVDFLSVGSNDLTQYILAVDRNNPHVANLYDALHPAVLRALIQTVEGGHQEGKHVSICGELAGDPVAILLLIAIGFDSLSMNASSLARTRWIVRHVTLKQATRLLQEVLSMESTMMIRGHVELALEKAGLGDLIRVGR